MNDFDRYAEARLARGILATFGALMGAGFAAALAFSGDFPAAGLAACFALVSGAMARG